MDAAPIGPGDYVECINASPHRGGLGATGLVSGATYCVRAVVRDALDMVTGEPSMGLLVHGVTHPLEPVGSFCSERFRPIYRRDNSLVARLLSDIPADAPASPEEVVA